MNRKRRINLGRLGVTFFILTLVFVIFGSVFMNAYESKLSADIQRVEKENKQINASIDGLEIEISNKTDFQYLSQVATKNGYVHNGDQTAYVVGDN